MLWYNKKLFKQAGLNPNDPPTDYAQILADAKKINKLGNGINGFTFAGDCQGCLGFTVQPGIWADGQHLTNGDISSQKATITGNSALPRRSPCTGTCGHSTWRRTTTARTTARPGARTSRPGKIGIMPGGYGQVVNLVKPSQLGTEFMDTPLPGANGGYSTFDGGDDFAIPTAAKNPSGAWEFIMWVLQPAAAAVPLPRRHPGPHRPAHPGVHRRAPGGRGRAEGAGQGLRAGGLIYNQMFNRSAGPLVPDVHRPPCTTAT